MRVRRVPLLWQRMGKAEGVGNDSTLAISWGGPGVNRSIPDTLCNTHSKHEGGQTYSSAITRPILEVGLCRGGWKGSDVRNSELESGDICLFTEYFRSRRRFRINHHEREIC